jgi:hypothetical protein
MFCKRSWPLDDAMSIRRYNDVVITVPVSPRIKMRLQRAIVHGIVKPTGALPTLRRAVIAAATELRDAGYADATIGDALELFVEEVVRTYALDARSVVSGRPRWEEVRERIVEWAMIDHVHSA